ncbi:YgcG family protein [Patescibacteria group bacterium]|nr:YgcG family protein [Patescibacteria group bacterium]
MMRIFKALLFLLLGIFLVTLPAWAQDFPKPAGHVNDFAEILSSSYRQSLEQELNDFENETTAEIAVVTINSLEGNSIEDYAVRLFEDWKIGKKEKDNGLLVLIAKEDREIRIEVGYGLEPVITDGRAGRVIREQMRPAFREENYDQGVELAVKQIEEYIHSGEPPAGAEAAQEKAALALPLIIFSGIILIYISSFLARSKRFWPGGVIGGVMGGILGLIIGTIISLVLLAVGLGLFGLLLDYILSKNYKKLKKAKKPTSFWGSWGGFSGGGGGGFGGFGGGSSGGGGASGGW